MTENLTPTKYLASADPILGGVIKRIELPERTPNRDYFFALVRTIIRQQLSGRAADAIERNFLALFDSSVPSPAEILVLSDLTLRGAGFSFSKISYIKNLARATEEGLAHPKLHAKEGSIVFDQLDALTNEEIVALLTQVKGIGQWTVEMFLMFTLERPDIFSYGDLGLRNAMQRLYKFKKHPSKRTAERIAKRWSPHRTLACRYLWASLQ